MFAINKANRAMAIMLFLTLISFLMVLHRDVYFK